MHQDATPNQFPTAPESEVVPPVTVNTTTDAGSKPPEMPRPAGNSKKTPIMVALVMAALLIVIVGGFLVLATKKNVPAPTPTPVVNQTPAGSPAPTPITTNNVDQTLGTTDQNLQNSINQANTDLNQVGTIDATQDTSTGL